MRVRLRVPALASKHLSTPSPHPVNTNNAKLSVIMNLFFNLLLKLFLEWTKNDKNLEDVEVPNP